MSTIQFNQRLKSLNIINYSKIKETINHKQLLNFPIVYSIHKKWE